MVFSKQNARKANSKGPRKQPKAGKHARSALSKSVNALAQPVSPKPAQPVDDIPPHARYTMFARGKSECGPGSRLSVSYMLPLLESKHLEGFSRDDYPIGELAIEAGSTPKHGIDPNEHKWYLYEHPALQHDLCSGSIRLHTVELPWCLRSPGFRTFKSCMGLTNVCYLDPDTGKRVDNTLPRYLEAMPPHAFAGCTSLVLHPTLPSGIDGFGTECFRGVTFGVKGAGHEEPDQQPLPLEISADATDIMPCAFEATKGYTVVIFPNCMINIRMYAFRGCTELTTVMHRTSDGTLEPGFPPSCFVHPTAFEGTKVDTTELEPVPVFEE